MPRRQDINWLKWEKAFSLGQLSAAEIGRKLHCATSTVTRHMDAHGISIDRAAEVAIRTQEAIATQRNEETPNCDKYVNITDQDVDDAVKTNIALVMSHRKDLIKLKQIEDKLLVELEGEPTKVHISSYMGDVTETVLGLTVTEKTVALKNLADVRSKRIEKQRQAFGIKETDGSQQDARSPEEILERLAYLEAKRRAAEE